MGTQINNMDYTTIENPYNNFVDRTITSDVPVSPDQVVRDGSSVKDLWVTAFIRSVNWKPRSVGFNIDGSTGDAEFNTLYAHNFKMLPTGGTNGSFAIFRTSGDDVFRINSSDYPFVEINPDPNNGAGTALTVTYTSLAGGLVADQPIIDLQHALSNVGSIGLSMTLNANSSADHNVYGIKMILNETAAGDTFALWLNTSGNGPPVVNAAVGGSQDYKIRIKIGSTTYFIPCYTA